MIALSARIGRHVVATFCARQVRRSVDLSVEGRRHLPTSGPVLLAARHVHHLLDGCILVGQVDRPLHVLVAVDWASPGPQRRLLDLATNILRWPAVIRGDAPTRESAADASRRLRIATRAAVALLREGEVVLVFPEGYPNVDPHATPKVGLAEMLPFKPGFVRIALLAERADGGVAPIVPVGFWYERRAGGRWRAALRFGEPVSASDYATPEAAAAELEHRVRALSGRPEHATSRPGMP